MGLSIKDFKAHPKEKIKPKIGSHLFLQTNTDLLTSAATYIHLNSK
jgi:hypothetical protein